MFGFKKTISPDEFGQGVFVLARDWIASDAGRALGMRFDDFDGSDGWAPYLERQGVSLETQKLHFRLFSHCVLQAAFSQFPSPLQHAMTRGGMQCFLSPIAGYDFDHAYADLDAAFRGAFKFDSQVSQLDHPEAAITFLPNSKVGVQGAQYLVQSFILSKMPNANAFIDDFTGYAATCCAAIGASCRATNHASKSFKMSAAA
ncbi:MAG: hypothetical protein WDN31_22900 [Hyphomicrobium sp.]